MIIHNSKFERLLMFFLLILILAYAFMTTYANLDLIDGKHVLFMDEQISFEGIQKIYTASDFANFWDSIVYGGDLRYGRIFWYSAALVAYLPTKLWGVAGQIVTTRMLQFIFLLISYILFAYTFIKNNVFRLLLVLLLLLIPSTGYYATMPKPEPIQLFFLSLFLYFFVKNNYRFGSFYIFLGISFGAKISIAPLVLLFYFISLMSLLTKEVPVATSFSSKFLFFPIKINIQKSLVRQVIFFLSATFFFLTGIIIANPILIISFIQLNYFYFNAYIGATFFNTSHHFDDYSINFLSWITYIFNEFTGIPNIILMAILLVFLLTSAFYLLPQISLKQTLTTNLFQRLRSLFKNNSILVWFGSFLLLLPIILFVKRIWDFYLHVGATLLVVALMISIEEGLTSKSVKFQNYFSVALLSLLLITIPFSINKSFTELTHLANRSKSDTHARKLDEYSYLSNLLFEYSQKSGRKLEVYFDPNLYLIESNEFFQIDRFYGPFLFWDKKFDLIIYYKEHSDEGALPNQTNILFEKQVLEKQLYKKFVVDKNPGGDFYYVKSPRSLDNVYIFIRNDLIELLGEM